MKRWIIAASAAVLLVAVLLIVFLKQQPSPSHESIHMLQVGSTQLEVRVPKSGDAYAYLQIPYQVSGEEGERINVSANAFEEAREGAYYDSFLPGNLQLDLEYLGNAPLASEDHAVSGERQPGSGFLAGQLSRHYVRVTNSGDTIIKAGGVGAINMRCVISNFNGTYRDETMESLQLLAEDLYPGESVELSLMVNPLPVGSYHFEFILGWKNDDEFFSHVSGNPIFTFKVGLKAKEERGGEDEPPNIVKLGQPLRKFPIIATDMKEFMHSARNIELIDGEAEGILELQIPPWDHEVSVKLVTSKGIDVVRVPVRASLDQLQVDRAKLNPEWVVAGADGDEPVITTWYYPGRATKFSNLPLEEQIEQDLREMKEAGINAVWMQLFPQWKLVYEPAVFKALEIARELDLKVIPSIYFHNQSEMLAAMYGVPIESAGAGGMADPLDLTFGTLLTNWLADLEADWGDTFYRTKSGGMPVVLAEEFSLGYPHYRVAGFSPGNLEAFRSWLVEQYGDLAAINSAWGTAYAELAEINPQLSMKPIAHYPEQWREGSAALHDFDRFRSDILTRQLLDTSQKIKARFPEALTGIHYFPVYNLEGSPGNHMYGFLDYNWNAARTAALEEYVFDRSRTGIDFVAYTNNPGEVDWSLPAAHAVEHGYTPIAYPEMTGARLVPGKGLHPGWVDYGGWHAQQGVEVRDFNSLYPILVPMLATVNEGGVAGFYSWNDHPLLDRATVIQKREIRVMADLLRGQ